MLKIAVLLLKLREFRILILALCLSVVVHGFLIFLTNRVNPQHSVRSKTGLNNQLNLNLQYPAALHLKSDTNLHQSATHLKLSAEALTETEHSSIEVVSLIATNPKPQDNVLPEFLQQHGTVTSEVTSSDKASDLPADSLPPENQLSVRSSTLNRVAGYVMPEPSVDTPFAVFDWFSSILPYYFPTHLLTEKPIVTLDVAPNLAITLMQEQSVTVIMRLKINQNGSIDKVEIDQTDVPDTVQDQLKQAFMKMRFTPGKIDHIAVNSEMKVEISLEKVLPKATILETIVLDQKQPVR